MKSSHSPSPGSRRAQTERQSCRQQYISSPSEGESKPTSYSWVVRETDHYRPSELLINRTPKWFRLLFRGQWNFVGLPPRPTAGFSVCMCVFMELTLPLSDTFFRGQPPLAQTYEQETQHNNSAIKLQTESLLLGGFVFFLCRRRQRRSITFGGRFLIYGFGYNDTQN